MAGLNVSKWQAARRKTFYDPTLQFFLRMIRTALDEAKTAGVKMNDDAIMARAWIARETPNRHADRCGYILSFQHCCEALGLNADYEMTWMLREIDALADFDTDEVHARVEYLTQNPPDEVEEELFESFRCVPALDQGSLFGMIAA